MKVSSVESWCREMWVTFPATSSEDKQQFATRKVRKGISWWNETSCHHFWAALLFIFLNGSRLSAFLIFYCPPLMLLYSTTFLIFEGFVSVKLNHSKIPYHASELAVGSTTTQKLLCWVYMHSKDIDIDMRLCGSSVDGGELFFCVGPMMKWLLVQVVLCFEKTGRRFDRIHQKCQRVQSLSLEVQQFMIVSNDHQSHPQGQQ